MTTTQVIAEVERIRAMSGDDEIAHGAEDELYSDVLHAIAEGRADDPAAVAREALKTRDINFARWYA